MRDLKIPPYNQITEIPPIMWTDILFLDAISLSDTFDFDKWTTIEYDSAFSTLKWHKKLDCFTGIRGLFWSPERLFVKSIAALYRHEDKRLGYELISIDRLVYPWELENKQNIISKEMALKDRKIAPIELIYFKDKDATNSMQKLNLYLLLKCCRNRNMEAIGYPHPLFLADKFAKNYLELIKPIMISGNKIYFRHPKFWTRRQQRDIVEGRRR